MDTNINNLYSKETEYFNCKKVFYQPSPRKAEWIIFFEKRVVFKWFRER
jgi:hypothetical protein